MKHDLYRMFGIERTDAGLDAGLVAELDALMPDWRQTLQDLLITLSHDPDEKVRLYAQEALREFDEWRNRV